MIVTLRGMTDAGTADWTNGTAIYWDDDQMQAVLDRRRMDVYRQPLTAIPDHVGASELSYKTYRTKWGNIEATDGGTAIFVVEDSIGNDQGTALWSADYARGVVTFGADQEGTAYYITGRSFDLNGAAADIWRMKAANAAKLYNFSTDSHSLSRSQIMEHCLKMCSYYENMSPVEVVEVFRSDLNAS
jgi:hypothetical protein